MNKSNSKESHYYYPQGDEINLVKSWNTLYKSKKIIIAITSTITMLGGIYAYSVTPIYEASALVEIGNYMTLERSSSGFVTGKKKITLDSESELATKLSILYIAQFKHEKKRKSKIISIAPPKKTKNVILIESEGVSNELARKEINNVVSYIQEKHGAILSDSKDRIDYELQTINLKINKNLPEQIKVFSQKIHVRKTELKKVSNLLNEVIKNIKNIEGLNPILTATQLIDKKNLMDKILDLKLQILNEQKETNIIRDIEIKKSIRDKKQLESTLLPHNYQNSALVGGILIDDSPSKPRKKLILVAAFSAGLVISIFFVLLINAFRQENETAK